MRNALLVYPEFPPSYWGFQYALELIGKRSAMPPLGLLTVAAMFPAGYRLRLVDMNVTELTDDDLDWADLVLTSTMVIQQRSLRDVIARCNGRGKPVVVGGPHPTSFACEIAGADHYLLGEVEETFPSFLADWEAGRAERTYEPEEKPAVTLAPVPRFDLLDLGAYSSMAVQFSRGCPFNCEFCDITKLFGRVPRTKSNEQLLAELDRLYELGWRGAVFLVDDNFIGNKREALRLLPSVAEWQRERGYPFDLYTEASVNLAKLEPLMDAMVEGGFTMVFLGIESPNPEALLQTQKVQNTERGNENYLLQAVRRIQEKGIEVSGGFILGLDGDGPEVFDAQVAFIQEAAIPMAMVGLLTALRGTDLYARLEREGRLLGESSGNNVEIALNFRPELDPEVLVAGYRRVLATLYDPGLESYFERCWRFLSRSGAVPRARRKAGREEIVAFLRSLRFQLFSRQGPAYFKFLARTLLRRPRLFDHAVRLAIKGFHFQRFTIQTLAAHDFKETALAGYQRVEELAARSAESPNVSPDALARHAGRARQSLRRRFRRLRPEFRRGLDRDRAWFEEAIQACVREGAGLGLVRSWTPSFRRWFSDGSWRSALELAGYAPTARRGDAPSERKLTVAPLLENGRLRRNLELFFRELGVRVTTTAEQLVQLGHERLERLHGDAGEPDGLLGYLGDLARRVNTLVVPLADELDGPSERVHVLAAGPESAAAALPEIICLRLERGSRQLRESVVDLGVTLVGDRSRAEEAFDRAFVVG